MSGSESVTVHDYFQKIFDASNEKINVVQVYKVNENRLGMFEKGNILIEIELPEDLKSAIYKERIK